ncbi:hypothetical protein EUGRSUZ_J02578 [Eucalyptus grandis]|nr:hypothetical protein EUGRSUZ_J02578 [Eucalyptus grandis]
MGEQEGRNVPVIDLQRFPSQYEKLRGACEEWGCFRVLNHGISEALMAEMKAVARSLLDLPMEAKKKKKNVVEGSGYLEPDKAYPLYESLGLWDMGSAQGVDELCSQSNASPHQREIMKIYREAVHELAMNMADELARSTGLSSSRFEDWACQLRLNKHSFKLLALLVQYYTQIWDSWPLFKMTTT